MPMVRLWVAVAMLSWVVSLSLLSVASGHFVTSLHSNFVVNLDFEGAAKRALTAGADGELSQSEDEEAAEEGDAKVIAFAGGKSKFRCRLPNSRTMMKSGGKSKEVAKSKQHFISAKLITLRGSCWKMKKEYWSYDVCFGRKVLQYRAEEELRFSLGEYKAASDELLPNGGVLEMYVGGADNRTSEIRYVCGSSEVGTRTFALEEVRPLYYRWTVSGPQFCTWREQEGTRAQAVGGGLLKVSSLLETLRGNCLNVTQGWWTYEYCYPRSLTQFHLVTQGKKKKRDPEYVLGTVEGTGAEVGVNLVDMSLVRLKPSISPRERRAPPSSHRTLKQRLEGGTVCDETKRPRATRMLFQCPTDWQSKPETRIISINEASLCEYDMIVHTTLVCGHERLLPTMPRGKETIQCAAEPKGSQAR